MTSLFKPGKRTYTLSAIALMCALLLQGDAQAVFTLAPMFKITASFVLTLTLPLIPVYSRKAIERLKAGSLSGAQP